MVTEIFRDFRELKKSVILLWISLSGLGQNMSLSPLFWSIAVVVYNHLQLNTTLQEDFTTKV